MPSVVRRRRVWFGAAVAAVVMIAAAVALAIPAARRRVRDEIEHRCAALVDGRCEIGSLEIARDGLVVRGLSIRFAPANMTARIHAIAVTLDWWSIVRRAPQSVRVVADGASFVARGTAADVVREISRLRNRRRGPAPTDRRVSLEALRIEGIDVSIGEATPIAVSLDDARAAWTRADGVEIEWRNASVVRGDDVSLRAGNCRVTTAGANEPAPSVSVRCDGPQARFDIASLDDSERDARDLIAALREFVRPVDAETPDASTSRRSEPSGHSSRRRITFQGRGGEVHLTRGRDVIADLRPAEISCELTGSRLERASARLGASSTGPALQLLFERGIDPPWHVELSGDQLPLAELARWVPAVPWHAVEQGRVQLRVRAEPAQRGEPALVVDGNVAIESFGLFHPGLAHDPIDGLTVVVEGAARVDPVAGRIETEGVRASVNGIRLALAGWAERPGPHEIALDASLRIPTSACDGIRRSLPSVVTGPVDELTFAGTFAADAHLALDTRVLPATELQIAVDDRCEVVRDHMQLGLRRLRDVFVQRVEEPAGLRAFVTGPGSAAWVPLAQISPYVAHAVLVREDGRFYRHHGFDVGEIRGAIIRDVGAHRFVYGASTLSMQLAKNIFLQREKTLVRKLQEVVLTWYLERSLDKDSILELYLNVVEFGPGIYGIGPAARFFFGREPSELSPLQAIYLATLLPNPTARFVNYQRGSVSAGTLNVLRGVARRMAGAGYLLPSEFDFAQTETIVFRPERTAVHGALTQTVDPLTTDEMAAAMSPPPTEAVPAVPDGDVQQVGDGAEENPSDTQPR